MRDTSTPRRPAGGRSCVMSGEQRCFIACASLQIFFIIHASLKGCFHCPYTPESCFHSPCTRAQPHFAFPPLSLILVISFSAKANLPITFRIKYFSVSFQLLSENPRKNITFNSPPNVWGCPWGVQVHSQGEANQRA